MGALKGQESIPYQLLCHFCSTVFLSPLTNLNPGPVSIYPPSWVTPFNPNIPQMYYRNHFYRPQSFSDTPSSFFFCCCITYEWRGVRPNCQNLDQNPHLLPDHPLIHLSSVGWLPETCCVSVHERDPTVLQPQISIWCRILNFPHHCVFTLCFFMWDLKKPLHHTFTHYNWQAQPVVSSYTADPTAPTLDFR